MDNVRRIYIFTFPSTDKLGLTESLQYCTSSSRLRFIVLSLSDGSARLIVGVCGVVGVLVVAGGCNTPSRLADEGTA